MESLRTCFQSAIEKYLYSSEEQPLVKKAAISIRGRICSGNRKNTAILIQGRVFSIHNVSDYSSPENSQTSFPSNVDRIELLNDIHPVREALNENVRPSRERS